MGSGEGSTMRNFIALTGKPTGKKPLRRPKRRWEDNITRRMDLKRNNDRNWIDSAEYRDHWRALLNGN